VHRHHIAVDLKPVSCLRQAVPAFRLATHSTLSKSPLNPSAHLHIRLHRLFQSLALFGGHLANLVSVEPAPKVPEGGQVDITEGQTVDVAVPIRLMLYGEASACVN